MIIPPFDPDQPPPHPLVPAPLPPHADHDPDEGIHPYAVVLNIQRAGSMSCQRRLARL